MILQTYYDCLLGPGLDVLRVELEAAGIEKKQIDVVSMFALCKQIFSH